MREICQQWVDPLVFSDLEHGDSVWWRVAWRNLWRHRARTLITVAVSDAFRRGDMQVLGRWTFATTASWQIHPLVGVGALTLVNPEDRSGLLAPGISWSTTGNATTRAGFYVGVGEEAPSPILLGSEYGSMPGLGYLSLSFFF